MYTVKFQLIYESKKVEKGQKRGQILGSFFALNNNN